MHPIPQNAEHEISRRRRTLILVNACVLTFMATLDGSIVNVALPVVAHAFAVGIDAVQWVVTSYLLTISAVLLVWGRLSDLHGRKRFFAAGLAIFTLGSFLCGLSANLFELVLARVLQAVGASMGMALVQGIVTAIFPPNERGKALGFVGTVVAVGSLLGPSLGGLIVVAAGWRAIFFVNVPVGIAGVILTLVVMPESKARADGSPFDVAGAVLLALAIIGSFGGMLSIQEGVFPPEAGLAAIAAAVALFALFIRVERSRAAPLVEGVLFRNPIFTFGIVAAWMSYVAMFAYVFLMPFYLQSYRHFSVLETGMLMSLYPVVTAVLAPLFGALSDRITYRPLTIAGLLVNAIVLAAIAGLGPSSSTTVIGLLIALLGVGGAAFQAPNNSSVMGAVPRDRLGIAGSLNSFFRNLGMVSGTTLAVSLFTAVTRARIDASGATAIDSAVFLHGFRAVALCAAAVALAGAAASAVRGRFSAAGGARS